MAWLAISFKAAADVADAVSDALLEAGALSVSCDDADAGTADETAHFAEPGQDPPSAWRQNVLTALVEAGTDPRAVLEAAATDCGIPVPAFSVSLVEDQDWVRKTQLQFEPMRVAKGLWIVPSWCEPPEPDAINIRIDPGLAFGTGSHPTTRLMLRWLARTIIGGESLLDYGCGSGILAITAARLGARDVAGIDIDAQALHAAAVNAASNGVRARFVSPEIACPEPAEIVVANILANPLIVLAPLLTSLCSHRLALSGILETQYDEVAAAYANVFDLESPDREDGWVLITGSRR
jgi:ribosomal protein L11 methyltransferase